MPVRTSILALRLGVLRALRRLVPARRRRAGAPDLRSAAHAPEREHGAAEQQREHQRGDQPSLFLRQDKASEPVCRRRSRGGSDGGRCHLRFVCQRMPLSAANQKNACTHWATILGFPQHTSLVRKQAACDAAVSSQKREHFSDAHGAISSPFARSHAFCPVLLFEGALGASAECVP
jgi:hypothetical protein